MSLRRFIPTFPSSASRVSLRFDHRPPLVNSSLTIATSIRTRFGTPLHEASSPKANPAQYGFGGQKQNSNNETENTQEEIPELNDDGTYATSNNNKSTGPPAQTNNALNSSGWGDPTERAAPILYMMDSDKPVKVRAAGVINEKGKRAPRRQLPSVIPGFVAFWGSIYIIWMLTYGGEDEGKKVINGRIYG